VKDWIKKIGQNKFQFFFFVGILALLVVALVVSTTITDAPNDPLNPPTDDPTDVDAVEEIKLPFANVDYKIVRKFYDRNETQENQILGLIRYGNSYRTSLGTSFADKNNASFDILACLSGKVVEIKENPLYGKYVVLEHKENIKTYYYGLSEVTVNVGADVEQGTKIGVSGYTEIDKEAGNHVYLKIVKGGKHLNPEKTIGKKITEII
jgi:stage II sporulation protein Q